MTEQSRTLEELIEIVKEDQAKLDAWIATGCGPWPYKGLSEQYVREGVKKANLANGRPLFWIWHNGIPYNSDGEQGTVQ